MIGLIIWALHFAGEVRFVEETLQLLVEIYNWRHRGREQKK